MTTIHLRNESDDRYHMPLLGLEPAIGSALVLLIAYLWSNAIVGNGGLERLSSINSPREFWAGLEVLLKTGLLWLIGGLGAIVFWPIVTIHLLIRIIVFVVKSSLALHKSKPLTEVS